MCPETKSLDYVVLTSRTKKTEYLLLYVYVQRQKKTRIVCSFSYTETKRQAYFVVAHMRRQKGIFCSCSLVCGDKRQKYCVVAQMRRQKDWNILQFLISRDKKTGILCSCSYAETKRLVEYVLQFSHIQIQKCSGLEKKIDFFICSHIEKTELNNLYWAHDYTYMHGHENILKLLTTIYVDESQGLEYYFLRDNTSNTT